MQVLYYTFSCQIMASIGSLSRTRTCDPMINSHLLYQLSYQGTTKYQIFWLPEQDSNL